MFYFAVLGPLVCFGPFCFPLGGFLLLVGLFTIAGHTEIAVRAGKLLLIDRCGFLSWTRRRSLEKLRGFRVEYGQPTAGSGVAEEWSQPGKWADLKIDFAGGKTMMVCRGYPREWLLPLAEELARLCPQVADNSETAFAAPVPVTEESRNPALIQDRFQQPTNSTAILEQRPDGVTITIPPAGLAGQQQVLCLLVFGLERHCDPFHVVVSPRGVSRRSEMGRYQRVGEPTVRVLVPDPVPAHRTRLAARPNSPGPANSDRSDERFSGNRATRRVRRTPALAAADLADVRAISKKHTDGEGGTSWSVALEVETQDGKTPPLVVLSGQDGTGVDFHRDAASNMALTAGLATMSLSRLYLVEPISTETGN